MAKTLFMTLFLVTFVAGSLFGGPGEDTVESLHRPRSDSNSAIAGYVLFGSIIVLGSASVVFELESDREYSRYLETAHPARLRSHYDRAERYRDLSDAALIGAEVCGVGLVVHLLRAKPGKEPRPGGIRFSLGFDPLRAGVSLGW